MSGVLRRSCTRSRYSVLFISPGKWGEKEKKEGNLPPPTGDEAKKKVPTCSHLFKLAPRSRGSCPSQVGVPHSGSASNKVRRRAGRPPIRSRERGGGAPRTDAMNTGAPPPVGSQPRTNKTKINWSKHRKSPRKSSTEATTTPQRSVNVDYFLIRLRNSAVLLPCDALRNELLRSSL